MTLLAEQQFADSIGKPELATLHQIREQLDEIGELASLTKAWEYIKGLYGFK